MTISIIHIRTRSFPGTPLPDQVTETVQDGPYYVHGQWSVDALKKIATCEAPPEEPEPEEEEADRDPDPGDLDLELEDDSLIFPIQAPRLYQATSSLATYIPDTMFATEFAGEEEDRNLSDVLFDAVHVI